MPSTISGSDNFSTANTVLQIVSTQRSDLFTGTVAIPIDDTIPQISEGDQIFSLSITPKKATSFLVLEVVLYATSGSNRFYYTGAVFRNGAADAVGAGVCRFPTDQQISPLPISFRVNSNSTATTTFTVRAGSDLANANFYLNGNGSGRRFGGVLFSSFKITEVSA